MAEDAGDDQDETPDPVGVFWAMLFLLLASLVASVVVYFYLHR